MIDAWMLWMVVVGVAIGLLAAWLLLGRLPREESDVSEDERWDEAGWISGIIERHGGVAPQTLVEEVLGLHQAYLREVTPRPGMSEIEGPQPPPGGSPGAKPTPGAPVHVPSLPPSAPPPSSPG